MIAGAAAASSPQGRHAGHVYVLLLAGSGRGGGGRRGCLVPLEDVNGDVKRIFVGSKAVHTCSVGGAIVIEEKLIEGELDSWAGDAELFVIDQQVEAIAVLYVPSK